MVVQAHGKDVDSVADLARTYFVFNREERQFCALLAHQLLQRGENLRKFLVLVDEHMPRSTKPLLMGLENAKIDQAQIYVEFAFLRDRWDLFNTKEPRDTPITTKEAINAKKHAFLLALMKGVPALKTFMNSREWCLEPAKFNWNFMGNVQKKIAGTVASPVHWRLDALQVLTGAESSSDEKTKLLFLDLCRFKWAFNIKPDVVIILPNQRVICVEAKLLSRESQYPSES
ncbi:MAG TPA: hypothetical protein VKT80_05265 [Chloroflexota bacterium]|nr:hypothetical protein [Chloroflexota bacterium]